MHNYYNILPDLIFEDTDFFNRVRPKMYIELHRTFGIPWAEVPKRIIATLSKYRYECEIIIPKSGAVALPMLACIPK